MLSMNVGERSLFGKPGWYGRMVAFSVLFTAHTHSIYATCVEFTFFCITLVSRRTNDPLLGFAWHGNGSIYVLV